MLPPRMNEMTDQITTNTEALKLFFTEDIYLVPNDVQAAQPLQQETEPSESQESVLPVAAANYKFHGENARKVLILVSDANNEVGTAAATALLWKIIGAIKLNPADCAVLNYHYYQGHDFVALNAFFQPQLFVSFGVLPATLGLQEQPTAVLAQQQGIHTIFSTDLDALEVDITLKKALWKSLQQLTLA